jgi:hypothetical protein
VLVKEASTIGATASRARDEWMVAEVAPGNTNGVIVIESHFS